MQQQIFAVLPIVFTFVFAGFAAGMVLYWTWSNTLSILQQYFIMRSQGVETEFDKWLA
jgi:YidC/Oxa1 family membrane protein insertase